jgi:hypothetical protein
MTTTDRPRLTAILVLATLLSAACGGGGGGGGPAPSGGNGGGGGGGGGGTTTYSVSVTVSGLAGSAVVLQDNGTSNLSIASNTTASFATKLASGAAYAVTVLTQPTGLKCTVAGGSGTVGTSNVSVSVSCAALVDYWTWIGGSNVVGAAAQYGMQGVAAPANTPGGRYFASSWTDASGNLWLFGGGLDNGNVETLNDLWKFNGSEWTWVSGLSTANNIGVYGTKGMSAPGNYPGARTSAATWVDGAGNLWMFGGYGFDDGTNTTSGQSSTVVLNDLWVFNTTTSTWTWMGGSSAGLATGVYGMQGSGSTTYIPGARSSPSTWFDPGSATLWLFGGYGFGTGSTAGLLNDLWKFDGTNWTWVSGSSTATATNNGNAQYGTQGSPASGNTPGARYVSSTWIDSAGTLWLFGGNVNATVAQVQPCINDLWTFTPGTGLWTWVGGSSTPNANGNYGSLGVAAAANAPGARFGANTWVDALGRFWLFGGEGFDATGNDQYLNDLWVYAGGQWTWVGGKNAVDALGSYGALGVANFANDPGARAGASAWVDATGKVGLFGGQGYDANGSAGYLGDLWKFAQN